MSGVIVRFDAEYQLHSSQVKDERVFRVVQRKFDFLRVGGLGYPSLNAKRLHNQFHGGAEVWEFYITKKWRCLFTYDQAGNEIVVLRISNHL